MEEYTDRELEVERHDATRCRHGCPSDQLERPL